MKDQLAMEDQLKQLFQQEFSKMVAVISRLFGLEHIETAEDIVSETFLKATETWRMNGLPPNPPAWLYAVAKQKALYRFRRNSIYEKKVLPAITAGQQDGAASGMPGPGDDISDFEFSPQHIRDSQLQMLFAVCTPAIAAEAQIGLALRILCGFGIDEIAEAFLCRKDTINKRLFRAKEKLRSEQVKMEMPPAAEITGRTESVLYVIYLLFNEGYYSRTHQQTLREDLCFEAMRLGVLLTGYEQTDLPETNALMALMCFHASRFGARRSATGVPDGSGDPPPDDPASAPQILYEEQDERLWDMTLINRGMYFLDRSMRGDKISRYHLEARIASWHCIKEDSPEKWQSVLELYDQLLMVNFSPSAALNRIFAFFKVNGAEAALREAEELNMTDNHFYFVLLGELYRDLDRERAISSFYRAVDLAGTPAERKGILRKLRDLGG